MSENEFAKKVRDLRAMHGLTLEQIALVVGVGTSTVRKWETGMIQNIRRDKIAKLAEALHTTPAYLMGWDDTEEDAKRNEKAVRIAKLLSSASDAQIDQIAQYIRFVLNDNSQEG